MPTVTGASSTYPLPTGWGILVGTTPIAVLPANPSRGGVMFINNGATTIAICPSNMITITARSAGPSAGGRVTQASQGPGNPAIGGAGSINIAPGGVFTIDTVNAGGGWNAISSAPNGALTILEF